MAAELIFLALVVFFAYAFFRNKSIFKQMFQGSRYRAYHALSQRFQGRYESRGINDPPTVSFTVDGATIRAGLAPMIPGALAGPRTRVVARFRRGIPFRLELTPVSRPASPQPPKGTTLVKSGNTEFDWEFSARANDPEMARDFLTAPVRGAVANLQRMVHAGGMLVSVNPERMLVQVDRDMGRHSELLIQTVEETLVILQGLLTGVAHRLKEGIEIVDHGQTDDDLDGPPICKVCGEVIDGGPIMVCTSCKTPHHRDCWEFVGICSIYGCGCKQAESLVS